ncbi:hypothetical protein GGI1_05246 [Acidithiobacillus sp. GGI-221]|nr:hypothetical protein GGI1_05246 [Acidithiobacillus sp. GGI-221]
MLAEFVSAVGNASGVAGVLSLRWVGDWGIAALRVASADVAPATGAAG